MRQWIVSAFVQVIAWRLFGAKPLPEPMLPCCQLDSWKKNSVEIESLENSNIFIQENAFEIIVWQSGGHFVQGGFKSEEPLCISHTVFPLNSLAPGKFEWNFRYLIFQIISVIGGWVIACELALRWMSLDLTYDKSTLVQVMAWRRQATSHYLSQCWPRPLSPYCFTRPQWVKIWRDMEALPT